MVRSFRCFAFCLFVLSIPYAIKAQSHVSRNGFVTRLDPPSSFRLNQQQVITTPSTGLIRYATNPPTEEDFSIRSISFGARVIVSGVEDKQTHVITAKRIELIEGGSLSHLSGEGIEDRAPALMKDGDGWRGKVYADGYAITVDPKAKIQLPQGAADADSFRPGLFVRYQAVRQDDTNLQASQLSFIADDNLLDEQTFREKSAFKVDLPDYDQNISGKVKFIYKDYEIIPYFKKTFEIIPNRELQKMIDALGQKLIPEWQKELQDSASGKIDFHFYIVKSTKILNTTLSDGAGTILIPAQLITKLQNEAQLASLLAADIAATIEKDTYRSRAHKHTQEAMDAALIPVPFGFAGQLASNGAFSAGYWTPLMEHEYRVGLRYVVSAGYDPREAPIALQRISEKHPEGATNKPLPTLGNYVDAELGFDYMTTDFTSLGKGEPGYAALRNMTLAADPKLKKD